MGSEEWAEQVLQARMYVAHYVLFRKTLDFNKFQIFLNHKIHLLLLLLMMMMMMMVIMKEITPQQE
jgi:hypothetical protein